jgi:two-component system OmpR family response regulator
MPQALLLIDDDARLFELLQSYLKGHDYTLEHAPDGATGLARLRRKAYDAVLLDVMMPGMDGLEVLRQLRAQSATPVLMLTARGDDADRIVGLELGADDYIPKPFNPRELLARLRAVLRRAAPQVIHERLQLAGLSIDLTTREVTRDDLPVALTALEFDLLVALARRPGRVLSRDALLSVAGRDDVYVNDRTVDVHISRLRQKLGDDSRAPSLIKTIRGVGYVLSQGAS